MSVHPVNVARVSQNLRSFNLLNTVRSNQVGLFRVQNQLATGLRFQAPSEEPTRAAAADRLTRKLDILNQLDDNLRQANATLAEGEQAMQDAIDLVMEANGIALETVGDTLSADERASLATVVESLLDQLVSVGNREYLDTFLFSGRYGESFPFEDTGDGVWFFGDDGRLSTTVESDLAQDDYTFSGMEFFRAVSEPVRGFVDLNPQLTRDTRISDLSGASDSGVSLGRILVSDGNEQVEIDLSGAATVGDVLDRLNEEMPAGLNASLNGSAIRVQMVGAGASEITIVDVAGGTTAVDLGIYTEQSPANITGADLDPRLTPRTRLADMLAGTGLTLDAGITIRNGGRVANITFNGAETLEDVINRIEQANVGVYVEISADGRSLDVRNRISGSDLTVEENGGTAATALGIRSMHAGTRVADLNDGAGVRTVDGDDFRINTADGTQVDVDLDALDLETATLQDVMDLLNLSAGGAFTASLTSDGNGLMLTDNTAGGGTLSVEALNVSPAAAELGLTGTASGNALVGADVRPVRVDSPFTALLELKEGLLSDDTREITRAAERLDSVLGDMQEVQGRLASKAKVMLQRTERVSAERGATEVLLSDVRDVDLSEALVRFSELQVALEANLQTSSRVLGLSLLDYL